METKVHGWEAIEYKKKLPRLVLSKYLEEGEKEGITLEEATQIAEQNPKMIFVRIEYTDL